MSRSCKTLMADLRRVCYSPSLPKCEGSLSIHFPLNVQGFGVCEFTSRQDAQDAIEQLDNSDLQGELCPVHSQTLLRTARANLRHHFSSLGKFCFVREADRSAS